MTCTVKIEVTDTFGGEANYCWVRRYEFTGHDNLTQRQVIRAAKEHAGWTGWNCKTTNWGNGSYDVRPVGVCQIMFISTDWE